MRLDFLGLQAFLSIAERGGFRAAATHLYLSQTALSHRLRKLEEGMGVRLLARTTRQLSLTPAGVELLPKARRLVEEMAAALDSVRAQARQEDERLAIGCLPTVAVMCLPKALARFHAAHPETHVRVFDNSASEIAERVEQGQAAFGVTILAANRWDLDLAPLAREPFVLVCRRDHPLARRGAVAWSEIAGEPLIRISAETGNRILIDDALGGRQESLAWRYEVQRVSTAVAVVRSGVGSAVVPQLGFDVAGGRDLSAVPLTDPLVARTLGVITRKGAPLGARARLMLSILTDVLRETIPDTAQERSEIGATDS